jgi:hypothetical protein
VCVSVCVCVFVCVCLCLCLCVCVCAFVFVCVNVERKADGCMYKVNTLLDCMIEGHDRAWHVERSNGESPLSAGCVHKV